MLKGGKLPIHYSTYITQSQAISGQDVAVNVSRAVTRLKSIFVTFYKAPGTERAENKEWLDFVHPMNDGAVFNSALEMEFQIQVGSKMFPEYPIRSISESYAHLKKSIGILVSNFHSMSISPAQYRNESFVLGIDCEKVMGAAWSLNTRAGDQLNIRCKALDRSVLTSAKMPDMMHVI